MQHAAVCCSAHRNMQEGIEQNSFDIDRSLQIKRPVQRDLYKENCTKRPVQRDLYKETYTKRPIQRDLYKETCTN